MAGTSGNPNNVGQARDLRRRRSAFVRAISQLPGLVAAPGPERPVRTQRQTVIIAGGNLHDPGQTAHCGRNAVAGGPAIAQLAEIVVSPRKRLPCGGNRQTVRLAERGGFERRSDRGQSPHLASIERGAIAQLTLAVATPRPRRLPHCPAKAIDRLHSPVR